MEGDMRALYAVMLKIRFQISSSTRLLLAGALTIGIRYSIVRRQFSNIDGVEEET